MNFLKKFKFISFFFLSVNIFAQNISNKIGLEFLGQYNIWIHDISFLKKLNLSENPINIPYQDTYNAIPIPNNMKNLPNYYAYIGDKHFIFPIYKKPELFLEEGDILVYFRNVYMDSRSLYDHITRGQWHVSIVGKDKNGKLKHFDSPSRLSSTNFSDLKYHIIRLKKYPTYIKNINGFLSWLNKPREVQLFLQERALKIKNINKVLMALLKTNYSYDIERKTEITIPEEAEKIETEFLETGNISCSKMYCSELPAIAYKLSSVDIPLTDFANESLDNVEENILNNNLNKEEKNNLMEASMDHFVRDLEFIEELDCSIEEINKFKTTRELPKKAKKIKEQYIVLLKSYKSLRKILLKIGMNERKNGRVIAPSEFFDAIFDINSEYSYVGSFIGKVYKTAELHNTVKELEISLRNYALLTAFKDEEFIKQKKLRKAKLKDLFHQLKTQDKSFNIDDAKRLIASNVDVAEFRTELYSFINEFLYTNLH